MTSDTKLSGFPPSEITTTLLVEGLVVFVAALAAYQFVGGNWWLFALFLLVPDLAMLGALRGDVFGARLYNLAHTYTLPAALAGLALVAGWTQVVPFVIIWIAHVGMDRTMGYGLKYPGLSRHTHLGLIGRAKKAPFLAHAR